MTDIAKDTRLSEQHAHITAALGSLFHPDIERSLLRPSSETSAHLRVADIAPGHQFSPTVSLPYGLDESSFTRLEVGDVSGEGIRSDLRGQFDVVAVRLLHVALNRDQWTRTFENLAALLKPGGWLQWVDWDPMTARIATVRPGVPDTVLREVLNRFTDDLRTKKVGNTYRISTEMRKHLEDDDSDMYTVNPEVRFTRNIVDGAILYLEQTGNYSAAEAKDVQAQVHDEIETASSLIFYDLWCHIARRSGKT